MAQVARDTQAASAGLLDPRDGVVGVGLLLREVHDHDIGQPDLVARQLTAQRPAPLLSITTPTLVVHGTADALRPSADDMAVLTLAK